MNQRTPDLDDLVHAHREGIGLTSDQHARNRARLLSRVAAGVAVSTAAAGASTSTAVAATASHASSALLVKVVIGLMVAGGAGAAYYASRPAPSVAVVSAPVETPPSSPPPALQEERAIEQAPTTEPVADIATPPPHAAKPSASGASSLANEIQIMHDVQAALSAGQPARALQLLDDAAKTYGGRYGGAMGEERAAARIVTLCRLGRTDEARAEAARFIHDRPRSPLVERVRSTCAKSSEPR
jgi:hypothetical protein